MFDITKLALKIPNFLTHEECDGLISEFKQRKNESFLEMSGNAKSGKIETNNYKVVSLKPNTNNFNFIRHKTKLALDIWIKHLEQPNYFFTKDLKNRLKFSHSYRIMEYKIGESIHPHVDFAESVYGSISFNLNEGYEGGEFKFFNGNYTVPLEKGDALIFPASHFWVHEVTKVTKGERYSLNSFICNTPFEAQKHADYLTKLVINDYINNTSPEHLLGPYN